MNKKKWLGAIALGVSLWLAPGAAYAETRIVEADGMYTVGDGPDENFSTAQERARADAQRAAAEQACVFVQGVTETKNQELTRDEIRTITAAILHVNNTKFTAEIIGENVIRYHCHIVAEVDSDNIQNTLISDKKQLEEATQRSVMLERQIEAKDKELAELKARFAVAASEGEKAEITKAVQENEKVFRANELVKQGNALEKGDPDAALKLYRDSLVIAPTPEAYLGIGHILWRREKFDDANVMFQKAIDLAPGNAATYIYIGDLYRVVPPRPEAQKYASMGSEAWGAYIKRYRAEANPKAIEYYEKAISADPENAEPYLKMALVRGGSTYHQYEEAIELCKQAVAIDPHCAWGYRLIGYNYVKLTKRDDAAIEWYEKAIAAAPEDALTYSSLARLYMKLGKYEKAIEYYKKYAAIKPEYASSHYDDMRIAYEHLGDQEKAQEYREKLQQQSRRGRK